MSKSCHGRPRWPSLCPFVRKRQTDEFGMKSRSHGEIMSNSEHDKKKKYSQRGLVIALGTSNQRARVALSYLRLTKPLLPRARHVGGPC